MIRASGAVAVAVAALLVCCSADPHPDAESIGEYVAHHRFDAGDYRPNDEYEDFLRFLAQYESRAGERMFGKNLDGIGGNTLLGRNVGGGGLGGSGLLGRNVGGGGLGGSGLLGRNVGNGGLGGSSLLGRNVGNGGLGGSSLLGRNVGGGGIGGSTLVGRSLGIPSQYAEGYGRYSRYIDSLGGGNLVRNLDSLGGGNLVRNLDSLGGGNLVKKNLDTIGGPNLIKRTLDSLGGDHKIGNLNPYGRSHQLVREMRRPGAAYRLYRRFELVTPRPTDRNQYGSRDMWPIAVPAEFTSYYREGLPKRNFDEIDRYTPDKRVQDFPMDEIDLSYFPIGSKRSGSLG